MTVGVPAQELFYCQNNEISIASESKPTPSERIAPARAKKIKVICVGGGGCNALNYIISRGIEGVETLAVNTDSRSLDMSLSKNKILLGEHVTKGLGAGSVPDIGEAAAKESIGEIRTCLEGAEMVYLAAGMGGGTGTGALPVIAAAAKDMGILTVAVVTKPFSFEGKRRMRYAEEGIEKLRKYVDAIIIVPNSRLLSLAKKDTPLSESFSLADGILRQAIQGVTDLITRPGMVNVDFADLKSIIRASGTAIMGVGSAKGEDRMTKAIKEALESPLMECSMRGAKGVLMNITSGDLTLYEVSQAASCIDDIIDENAAFVWGCVEDNRMDDEVEIVVIATGFEEGDAPERMAIRLHETQTEQKRVAAKTESAQIPAAEAQTEPTREEGSANSPEWLRDRAEEPKNEEKPEGEQNSYDTPTYLRRGLNGRV